LLNPSKLTPSLGNEFTEWREETQKELQHQLLLGKQHHLRQIPTLTDQAKSILLDGCSSQLQKLQSPAYEVKGYYSNDSSLSSLKVAFLLET